MMTVKKLRKLRQLRDMIEEGCETGSIKKIRLTVALKDVLVNIFQELHDNNSAEFIQSDAVKVLEYCGIDVTEKGIGFIAHV